MAIRRYRGRSTSLLLISLVSVCVLFIFLGSAMKELIYNWEREFSSLGKGYGSVLHRSIGAWPEGSAAAHVNERSIAKVVATGTDQIKQLREQFRQQSSGTHEIEYLSLPLCPLHPTSLVGKSPAIVDPISIEEVVDKYRYGSSEFTPLELGGKNRPTKCRSRDKLAIVIPYRNRYSHLLIVLNNIIPLLQRQQTDFQIFVIDLDMPTEFNRGLLLNIGFLEALKLQQFNCFIFHDVDLLPMNDHGFYRCHKEHPVHLIASMDKWVGDIAYPSLLGGATAFSKEQFLKLNGYSNLYFGWGGEDDDIYARTVKKNYMILRQSPSLSRFRMIEHGRDHGNEENLDRFKLLTNSTNRMSYDGVNTTVYTVTKIELNLLFTWICVAVNRDTYQQAKKRHYNEVMAADMKRRLDRYKAM